MKKGDKIVALVVFTLVIINPYLWDYIDILIREKYSMLK